METRIVQDVGTFFGTPLTFAIFVPLVGALVMLLIPKSEELLQKVVALATSLVAFGIGVYVLWTFDYSKAGDMQMSVNLPWIEAINSRYILGVDGIALPMFALTVLIVPLCIIYSWNHFPEPKNPKAFLILILVLETGMIGSFLAEDLILFFVFFEIVLLPMYFMIGVWGGENRQYASIKFFLYTLFGSALMIVSFLALYFSSEMVLTPTGLMHSFDITLLPELSKGIAETTALLIFGGMFIGFGIKVPMFPFHTWLPDAHTQAPTVGSVILAAVLLKLGTYGFIRISIPILPEAALSWSPIIGLLAVIGIIYGALCCYAQTDMKKLVAYSSVSHMGFIVLGIFALSAAGMQGSILQMVNHGISTGGLFLIVGMLYERRHTRQISAYGGLWAALPLLGGFALILTLSSMGMPGTNGFVGEFTILLGSLNSDILGFFYSLFAATGVILAAIYMLAFFQKVFMGEVKHEENWKLPKLHWTEIAVLVPIVILILWIGLAPNTFLAPMDPSINALVTEIQPPAAEIALLP